MTERIDDLSKFTYMAEGVPYDCNHHDYCLELSLPEGESLKAGSPVAYAGKGKCTKYDGTKPFYGILKHQQWANKFGNGSLVNIQQDQRIHIKTKEDFEITGASLPKIYVDSTGNFTSTEASNKLVGVATESSLSSTGSGEFWTILKITGVQ